MQHEIVFIDFDGVIANTYPICFSILKQVQPEITEQDFRQKLERNIIEELIKLQDTLQIDFWDEYAEQILKQPLVPEITAAIEKISLAHPLIIVSSSRSEDINRYLDYHHLTNHFTKTYGSETAPRKREIFTRAIKHYRLPAKESVFVTDTMGDIVEAHQAGIQPLAVTWGFHTEDILRQASPVAIIDTPQQLSGAIEEAFDFSEEYD